MGNPWSLVESSLELAIQDDLNTQNATPGDFQALPCESPSLSFETAVTELEILTGQPGAAPERIIGARKGTLSFQMPLEGLKEGYNGAIEWPGMTGVLPRWFVLAANMMGCDVSNLAGATTSARNTNFWLGSFIHNTAARADDVTLATTSAITVDPGSGASYAPGAYVMTAEGATSTTLQRGWIQSVSPADVLNLLFDSANAVSTATTDSFGTATAYLSTDQAQPLTARYVGSTSAAIGYVLIGLVGEGFKIGLNAEETPVIEFTYRFADYVADNSIAGLVVPAAFPTIAPIVGTNAGRVTLAGVNTCDLTDVSLELAVTLAERKCHSAVQGVYQIVSVQKRMSLTATIAQDSADPIYNPGGGAATQGAHKWQSYLERGIAQSFGVESGTVVGGSFAAVIPAGKLIAVPQIVDQDGYYGYQLSMEASAYAGDGSSTAPGNTVGRLSLS